MNTKIRIKRVLLFGLIGGLIIGIFLFMLFNIDITGLMIEFTQSFYDSFGNIGVYISIFLLSIIGNFTVILPVPYLLALISIILILPINPIIIGLFAGAGAAIGETTAWFIGRGASEVIDMEKKRGKLSRNIKGLNNLIERGYAFPLIILFAITPLPDDVLLITLGVARYSLKKSVLATFIGKVMLTMGMAGFAVLSKTFPLGQFILRLYGINIVGNTVMSSQNPVVSNIVTVSTIAIIFLLFTVDWTKLFKKKV